jgi:hypothetical protein
MSMVLTRYRVCLLFYLASDIMKWIRIFKEVNVEVGSYVPRLSSAPDNRLNIMFSQGQRVWVPRLHPSDGWCEPGAIDEGNITRGVLQKHLCNFTDNSNLSALHGSHQQHCGKAIKMFHTHSLRSMMFPFCPRFIASTRPTAYTYSSRVLVGRSICASIHDTRLKSKSY